MNRYFPFTWLSRDGLVGRAVRSIGLTFIIILSCRFSHSILPSLGGGGGVEDDGWGMVLGVGLVGRAAWIAGLVT